MLTEFLDLRFGKKTMAMVYIASYRTVRAVQ